MTLKVKLVSYTKKNYIPVFIENIVENSDEDDEF